MAVNTPQAPAGVTTIDAEHLKLCLIARRLRPGTRWAALAARAYTPAPCSPTFARIGPIGAIRFESLMAPMERGKLHNAIRRMRLTQGLPAIRRTFGAGLRALLAEPAHIVPAQALNTPRATRA